MSKTKSGYGTGFYGLPSQTVSRQEKETDEWQHACMDFMDSVSSQLTHKKMRALRNYQVLSPDYQFKDPLYLDPLSLGEKVDEDYGKLEGFRHYPVCSRPIYEIVGERINRPIEFYCISEGTKARNEFMQAKTDMLQQYVQSKFQQIAMQQAQQAGIDVNTQEGQQQMQQLMPPEIEEYMNRKFSDVAEQVSQRTLRNMWLKNGLNNEFIRGFKHAVITAKEFYHIYVVNHKTRISNLSPLDTFYQKSPSKEWVSESEYAGFRWYLTPSSVLDMYRTKLTHTQVEEIEQKIAGTSGRPGGDMYGGTPNVYYDTSTYANQYGLKYSDMQDMSIEALLSDYNVNSSTDSHYLNRSGLLKVVQAYWVSKCKIGYLTTYDENDIEVEIMVDASYKADKTLGESIRYEYMNQVYQGTKVEDDMYVDIRPYEEQHFDENNIDSYHFPIEGSCYNDYYTEPTSLVDLMMPWQELYNIVAYEIRRDMRKSIGKVMYMSYDHIPKVPGFSKEKWLYWVRESGIAWVAENQRKTTFSHYSAQDMSFVDSIYKKMEILDKIQGYCDSFAGFSANRIASSTSPDPTARQANQSLTASVNQTEYFFHKHFQIMGRVLTQAVNVAKRHIKYNPALRNLYDDIEQAYIDFDAGNVEDAEIGVYLTNTKDEIDRRQLLKQTLTNAVANGGNLIDASKLMMATTQSEIENILEQMEKQQRAQQQQEQQLKQGEQQLKNKELEDKKMLEREKMRSNERIAFIKAHAFQKDVMADETGDEIPDILQYDQLMAEIEGTRNENPRENRRLQLEEKKHSDDSKARSRELELKDKELNIEKDNQKNDLQIERMRAKKRTVKSPS